MWSEEYTNLLSEFTSAVEDELLQYVRGLILFGSYLKDQIDGPGYIIPGVSDLDLVLVVDLDDINPEKQSRRLGKIGEALSVFFVHPTYAPIFDLTLIEYKDLPTKLGMAFSPIHLVAASQGKTLLGKNVLKDITFSEKQLNRTAKVMINQGYESVKTGYLQRVTIGDHNLALEFADIVLDMAHSTLAATGIFNLVRPEVPEKFDLLLGNNENFDSDIIDIVYESHKWRMGSQKMNKSQFLIGCLNFAQAIMDYIRNPFNSNQ